VNRGPLAAMSKALALAAMVTVVGCASAQRAAPIEAIIESPSWTGVSWGIEVRSNRAWLAQFRATMPPYWICNRSGKLDPGQFEQFMSLTNLLAEGPEDLTPPANEDAAITVSTDEEVDILVLSGRTIRVFAPDRVIDASFVALKSLIETAIGLSHDPGERTVICRGNRG